MSSDGPSVEDAAPELALTSWQAAIWLDQALHPGRPIYNTGQVISIGASLDVGRFESALRQAVAEHDALRLRFLETGTQVLAQVEQTAVVELEYRDFTTEDDPKAAGSAWIDGLFRIPLTPSHFPLFRFALAKLGDAAFLWLQAYHHLIIDATSRKLFAERVATLYEETPSPVPVTAAPVSAARQDEEAYLASPQYGFDEGYWTSRFAEPSPVLPLPDLSLSERCRSGRAGRVDLNLTMDESVALRTTALQLGTTVFKLTLACAWSFFSRLYGESGLTFGVPLANRSTAQARRTVGLFSKVLPFMPRIRGAMSLADALASIEADLAADLRHHDFPGDRLGRIIRQRRGAAGSTFDIMVNYLRADYSFMIGGQPITCLNLSSGFAVPWSITVSDFGPNQPIQCVIDHDPGRVTFRQAQQLRTALRSMLSAAAQCAALPIASLPLDEPGPRLDALFQAHGQQVPLPADATVPYLLARQLERTPDAIALIHGATRLTFRELHARADQLASHLVRHGVAPGTIVGVLLPRTVDLLIALLAIHKTAGAYLPLDPGHPRHRIDFMLTDSGAGIVVTDRTLASMIASERVRAMIVPQIGDDIVPFRSRAASNGSAYVLYTSGSSGAPKGVVVTHESMVNMLLACRELIEPEDLHRVLFATSVSFDISVYEMFMPLAFGGTVVLVDDLLALANSPVRDDITLINTVPSLMHALLGSARLPARLRVINLAGEALPRTLVDAIFAASPEMRLFNLYGPTETTVYSSWSQVAAADRDPPPIGQPIWNTSLYVVDESGNPVPDGAAGELWIGGIGVARAYLNRPELTEERFRPNPFAAGRIYRTGDRVRFLPDGQLAYLGRADRQVKINGVRIEPGEIETVLRELPGIAAAAVAVRQEASGRRGLAGYLVADRASPAHDDMAIISALSDRLPAHMIPRQLVWLDRLPLTANGKVDHAALPPPAMSPAMSPSAAPRDGGAADPIASAFAAILGCAIAPDDDFFMLGGDSLAAIRLILELERTLSMPIPRGILHAGRTPRQVGRRLADLRTARLRQLEPIRAGEPDGPALFVLSGIDGTTHEVEAWIAAWPSEWTIYGILDRAAVEPIDPADSMTELAEQASEAILAADRPAPYHLLGYSFGGRLAYETAVHLHANGHEVGFLGIMDTPTWIEDDFPVSPTNMIVQARRRSTASYHIPRCDVPVTFFRATESWVDQPDDYFWSRTASRVDVVRLRGSHHTFGGGSNLPSLARDFFQALHERGLVD